MLSFKTWFAGKAFIVETEIVAEIKALPQTACLLGSVLNIPAPDLIKFELTMKGIYRTDLVLGNDAARAFALIEFEPGEETTRFKRGTAEYRYWDRGLSMASARSSTGRVSATIILAVTARNDGRLGANSSARSSARCTRP